MKLRKDRKAERVAEGEQRNAAWRALSPADQLNILNNRPGKSARQRAKLQKAGLEKAFAASPEELGAAAVAHAAKK